MKASERVHVRDTIKILKSVDEDMCADLQVFGTHDQKVIGTWVERTSEAIQRLEHMLMD